MSVVDRLAHIAPIIEQNQGQLLVDGVQMVRPGYKLDANGWPTKTEAIVVLPKPNAVPVLPADIQGIPVEIRQPNEFDQARFEQPAMFSKLAAQRPELETGAFREFQAGPDGAVPDELAPEILSSKPQLAYTAPNGTRLQPVSGEITVTCHASPDAGWPTLKAFLQGTQRTLTIGMYDFTSGHILDAFENDLAGNKKVTLTLDHPAPNPTADQSDDQTVQELSDSLGANFTQAWALVKTNPKVVDWVFPNAYHIKVAVRDSSSVWLSSGNWNNSNQPDIDPINDPQPGDQKEAKKRDRDWHVIIESEEIAKQFEAYLKNDETVASQHQAGGPDVMSTAIQAIEPAAFKPGQSKDFVWHAPKIITSDMTVTPLLTPDAGVYQPEMLRRIQAVESKLYIQLQYIHPSNNGSDDAFNDLISAVSEKINDGVDVKIIVSQYQKSNGWLERLQSSGIDLANVKIQNGVHNKGFIFDSAAVAIGSENWSGDGVLRNRDATVVIENQEAVDYFEEIFLHDWNVHASQSQ